MKLPKHVALTLEHNPHVPVYYTVQEYERLHPGMVEWLDDEQQAKAYLTQELWMAVWYPDNPIGFEVLWAADLSALLAALEEEP